MRRHGGRYQSHPCYPNEFRVIDPAAALRAGGEDGGRGRSATLAEAQESGSRHRRATVIGEQARGLRRSWP